MLIMMHDAGGICPVPHRRAWEEEEEEDWETSETGRSEIRPRKGTRGYPDFQKILHSLCFHSVSISDTASSSSWLGPQRLLPPNPNIKRKQKGAFAHLSEQRLQVRGRRTMGIEQGLFLFVYPAHSLTPEVFFFPPLVFVLETCVCARARKCVFVTRRALEALGLDLKTTRRCRLTRPLLTDCSVR